MPGNDDDKNAWVGLVTGAAVAKKNDDAKALARKQAIEKMRGDIAANGKDALKAGLTFKVMENGKELVSQGEGVADKNLIETEDAGNYTLIARQGESEELKGSGDQMQAQKLFEKLIAQQEKMKSEMVKLPDGTEVRLFDDQDIADELWEPLYREGLCPENLIPAQYSNVQKMQTETRNLYHEWTKEQQAAGNEGNAASTTKLVSMGSEIGKSIAGAFGDTGEIASAAITLVELTVNTGIEVYKAWKKADLLSCGNSVLDNAIGFVTAAVSIYDKDIGSMVGTGMKTGVAAAKFAYIMSNDPDEKQVAEALAQLGTVFAGVGDLASHGANGKAMEKVLSDGGDWIGKALSKGTVVVAVRTAVRNKDRGAVISILTNEMQTIAVDVGKQFAKEFAATMDEETLKDLKSKGQDPESLAKSGEDMSKILTDAISGGAALVLEPAAAGQLDAAAGSAVSNLATEIGKAMGKIHPTLPAVAAGAVRTFTSAAGLASGLKVGRVGDAINVMAAGVQEAVQACLPTPVPQPAAGLAAAVAAALKAKGMASVKAIRSAIEANKPADVITALDACIAEAVKALASGPGVPQVKEAFAKSPEAANKVSAALAQMEIEDAKAAAKEEEDAFGKEMAAIRGSAFDQEKNLALGEGGQEAIRDKAIANLIMRVKLKRALLEAAAKMASSGLAVAAQFYGPMAAAGAGLKFLTELTAAAEQAAELRKWLDSKGMAQKAVSMFEPAIQNFIDNREAQIAHHTIKAALAFVKMCAAVTETALTASGYGGAGVVATQIVQRAMDVGDKIEDFKYEVIEKGKVDKAWRNTRESLLNPNNRKLAKKAMVRNHTWSKYAIAWGATKGDSIAVATMQKIGLSQESLLHKDTDVQKVKSYLEAIYPEDKQVLKSSPLLADWLPKKVGLTSACLAGGLRRGIEKAQPKLDPAVSGYDLALACVSRHVELHAAYVSTHRNAIVSLQLTEETVTFMVAYRDQLGEVVSAMKAVRAKTAKSGDDPGGKPHTGFREFARQLQEDAEAREVVAKRKHDEAVAALAKIKQMEAEELERTRLDREALAKNRMERRNQRGEKLEKKVEQRVERKRSKVVTQK